MKIKFGNTGSGDWIEVNEESKANECLLIYNDSISKQKFVVEASEIDILISALRAAKCVLAEKVKPQEILWTDQRVDDILSPV